MCKNTTPEQTATCPTNYIVTVYEVMPDQRVPYEQFEFTTLAEAEQKRDYANTWAPVPDEDGWYMMAEITTE